MSNEKTTSGGIGFTSLLLLSFIILKLTGYIDWSWFWVLSPFWIPASLVLLLLAVYGVVMLLSDKKEKNKPPEKSKWQERLEQVQEAQRKAQQSRNTTH